jgi:hypothetical protein
MWVQSVKLPPRKRFGAFVWTDGARSFPGLPAQIIEGDCSYDVPSPH